MKKLYLVFIAVLISTISISQTILVGGQCMSGSITLDYVTDLDGKPAYLGTGTVATTPGTEVSIFWIGAPDNLWVIAFDGQPYFQNACNSPIPPGTANAGCTWATVAATTCTGAGALTVSGAVALPVTLTQFTARSLGTQVSLQWKTVQESNNRGFTVQRSADGLSWADIGFVSGAGSTSTPTSYQYTDLAPYDGNNFYRLRQEDIDGKTSFSSIEIVNISNKNFFAISDNPGPGIYKLTMPASAERLQLVVTDANGKVILQKNATAGNQLIDISKQAPGVYWLLVKKGTGENGIKLIKF